MQSQPYIVLNGGSSFTVGILSTRSLGITQTLGGTLIMFLGAFVFFIPRYSVAHTPIAMVCGVCVNLFNF